MVYSSKDWLEQLQETSFPVLGSTPKQIKEIIHKKSSNYTELANIIRHDPGFCLQILGAINKTLSRKRTPLFSINQALSLLGMEWLEAHFEQFPLLCEIEEKTSQKPIADCYSRILYATGYAAYYAQLRRDPQPNELATAILLEHAAEISLWLHKPEVARCITQLPSYSTCRAEASKKTLETITLTELNQLLINRWNMPQLNHDLRSNCIKLSCAISQESTRGWYSKEMMALFDEAAIQTQKEVEEITSGIHHQAVETARSLNHLELTCPAYNLIFWPPPQPAKQARRTDEPTSNNSMVDQKKSSQVTPSKQSSQTKKVSGLDAFITRAMQQLHKEVGLQRIAFIQLSANKKELRIQKIIDTVGHSKLRDFRIAAQNKTIFSLLLIKPQQLWMHKENLKKHAALIPEPISELLDSPEFFVASIFNQQGALGVIYADNGTAGSPLNKTMHAKFTRSCQQIYNEAKQEKSRVR
jgi:hypothetical protein